MWEPEDGLTRPSRVRTMPAVCQRWQPATTHTVTTFGTLSPQSGERNEGGGSSGECTFNPSDFEVDFFKTWVTTPPTEFDDHVLWRVVGPCIHWHVPT